MYVKQIRLRHTLTGLHVTCSVLHTAHYHTVVPSRCVCGCGAVKLSKTAVWREVAPRYSHLQREAACTSLALILVPTSPSADHERSRAGTPLGSLLVNFSLNLVTQWIK